MPAANAEVRGAGKNSTRPVTPLPYEATVLPEVLNVHDLPGLHGTVFGRGREGDKLNVAGFTHNWAAVDITLPTGKAKLGFVHRSKITPP